MITCDDGICLQDHLKMKYGSTKKQHSFEAFVIGLKHTESLKQYYIK